MEYFAYGPYFAALVAYAISPGPLMAVLVARSLGRDWQGVTAFAAGLCIGEVIAVIAVAFGIGVWAESSPQLLAIAKYVGIAYLWLAFNMWRDRKGVVAAAPSTGGWLAAVVAGVALCLGNPATLLMQILLLPMVAPVGVTDAGHMALIAAVTFVAFGLIFFGTIPLARQFNRLIGSPMATLVLGRSSAVVIALTSLWMAAS